MKTSLVAIYNLFKITLLFQFTIPYLYNHIVLATRIELPKLVHGAYLGESLF